MAYLLKDKIYILSKKYGQILGLDLPFFIKNGFWVFLKQVASVICSLALYVAFTRLATQEVFGQYQFILSILSTVSIFSLPGLNYSILRSAARGYDGDYRKAVKTSFFWSLLGVPTLLIIGAYYYVYQGHLLGIALMLSSIFFPFFYAPNTWNNFLQGKSRFDVLAKYGSIQAVVNSLVVILFIFFSRNNLLAIMISYLASYAFFNGYYYFKSLKYVENNKNDEGALKYGWFLTKINILGIIYSNIDKIIVGIFLSQSQLAIYAIGIFLPKQFQDLTKSFFSIVALKQIKQKKVSVKDYLKIFIFSLGVSALILGLLPLAMHLLFPDNYNESIKIARIVFLFYPFFAVYLLYMNEVILNKREKSIKIQSIGAPVIGIIAMISVLPFFGIYGLAFLLGFQYITTIVILYLSEKLNCKNKKVC